MPTRSVRPCRVPASGGRPGNCDGQTAEDHAVAVLAAVRIAVGDDEFNDLTAQLPRDFQPMLEQARRPHMEVRSANDFLSRVVDRTRLDPHAAGRATQAALETLGEHITNRQIEDLSSHLWEEAAQALDGTRTRASGATRKLPATSS